MLDGNEDMRKGSLSLTFKNIHLREVILERHGQQAPSTYKRNTKDIPIDGIWATAGVQIQSGGYIDFDAVIPNTDHRTIWIDITYMTAFAHKEQHPIIRPTARRLNNQIPTYGTTLTGGGKNMHNRLIC
jgi:hypothetical protein